MPGLPTRVGWGHSPLWRGKAKLKGDNIFGKRGCKNEMKYGNEIIAVR